jgi:iron complex transport system ATP-binding protein
MPAAHSPDPAASGAPGPNGASGAATPATAAALTLAAVTIWEWDERLRQRQPILTDVGWRVGPGEQWALLGPNGAGKSTLLDVAAGMRHPSRGQVDILGETVGRVDLRALRERIGHVDVKTEEAFSPRRTALQVVLTGATGTIQVLEERVDAAARERAAQLLEQFGCAAVARHSFVSCSQGERRRILLARALMRRPPLLLLDEPADGLDLPGREALLAALATLAGERPAPAVVLVTHHLEELPTTITHALLLRDGRVIASGAAPVVLADGPLSACYGVRVTVSRGGGGWGAVRLSRW